MATAASIRRSSATSSARRSRRCATWMSAAHQAALVAMRTDGRVVAMLGGRDYGRSTFNRATQSRRQPGSTFKVFVYLAALARRTRTGRHDRGQRRSPAATIVRATMAIPISGEITPCGGVRPVEQCRRRSGWRGASGSGNVIRAARDLGITAPMREDDPSIALGTANVSLLEMTAAYAAIAAGAYPVDAARHYQSGPKTWASWSGCLRPLVGRDPLRPGRLPPSIRCAPCCSGRCGTAPAGRRSCRSIRSARAAPPRISRDALFIGFAGDLVVGVWVGDDNNQPMQGVTGGGLPARVWRAFMLRAMRLDALEPAEAGMTDVAAPSRHRPSRRSRRRPPGARRWVKRTLKVALGLVRSRRRLADRHCAACPARFSRPARRASPCSPAKANRSPGAARSWPSRSMSLGCRLMLARPSSRWRTGASSAMSASIPGASPGRCVRNLRAGRVREGGSNDQSTARQDELPHARTGPGGARRKRR